MAWLILRPLTFVLFNQFTLNFVTDTNFSLTIPYFCYGYRTKKSKEYSDFALVD